jgi:hypothetical protein
MYTSYNLFHRPFDFKKPFTYNCSSGCYGVFRDLIAGSIISPYKLVLLPIELDNAAWQSLLIYDDARLNRQIGESRNGVTGIENG